MARSRNPAETVVALLVVPGINNAEVLATEMLTTGGLTDSRRADVSPWQNHEIHRSEIVFVFPSRLLLLPLLLLLLLLLFLFG